MKAKILKYQRIIIGVILIFLFPCVNFCGSGLQPSKKATHIMTEGDATEVKNIEGERLVGDVIEKLVDSDMDGVSDFLEESAEVNINRTTAFFVDPEGPSEMDNSQIQYLSTISEAIEAAKKMGKAEEYKAIFVAEETKEERLNIEGANHIKIIGGFSKHFGGVTTKSGLISVNIKNSDHVEINGFEIDGNGIEISNSKDILVKNNHIIVKKPAIPAANTKGIKIDVILLSNCNLVNITGNNIIAKSQQTNDSTGVEIIASTDVKIADNHIYAESNGAVERGIEILGSSVSISKNVIHTKDQRPKMDFGILVDYESEVDLFTGNLIFNTGTPIQIDYTKLFQGANIVAEIHDITDTKTLKSAISKSGKLFSGKTNGNKTVNLGDASENLHTIFCTGNANEIDEKTTRCNGLSADDGVGT